MKNKTTKLTSRVIRFLCFGLVAAALFAGVAFIANTGVEANHPVLVEGNCDSPVPGTTLVSPGTCGDFDGDGRIGTAEDTDGADRIFGTINAAMGPGTGAAAGTGANHNGSVIIVASGRYAEQVYIGQQLGGPGSPGTASPGNVTLEAAPGVHAEIDAVLQGDPAGGNATRQNGVGIEIGHLLAFSDRIVTIRNLTIRNFTRGVAHQTFANVVIDNCRIAHNLANGIYATSGGNLVIRNSVIEGNGRRIGGPSAVPSPGEGLVVLSNGPQVRIVDSVFAHNVAAGINNLSASSISIYKVATYFNNPNLSGVVAIATDPNFAQ